MGVCTSCENFGYDPITESPAAYVCMMRERAMEELLYADMDKNQAQDSDDEEWYNSLTKAEQRAYYDKKVKSRLNKMSAGDQAALFKRFNVSVSKNPMTRYAQLKMLIEMQIRHERKVSCPIACNGYLAVLLILTQPFICRLEKTSVDSRN